MSRWEKRLALEALKAAWLANMERAFKDWPTPEQMQQRADQAAEELDALVRRHYAERGLP